MESRILRYAILFFFAFIAELIDGGIGMGYGVSLTSMLLSVGFGTAMASAVVHLSEIFVSLASGVSHYYLGNFDRKIFTYLSISGVVGGIAGAIIAVKLSEAAFIRPVVAAILLCLGLMIIIKYTVKKEILMKKYRTPRKKHLIPLGLAAAFIDAIGGGGWGPVSTPVLIIRNTDPKKTIGSVNFAEFFVTVAISITFLVYLPAIDWHVVLALVAGGLLAAPVAALITSRLPHRVVGIAVGILVIALSIRTIFLSLNSYFTS
jgi:uncharacterized membrane protein YfcA